MAEVLITLGIIGVISILTLPTLISDYRNKVYIAQLQKVYNQLSNQLIAYRADSQTDSLTEAGLDTEEGRRDFFNNYFKVVKTCDGASGCFADEYNDVQKKRPASHYENLFIGYKSPCVTINTGASICFARSSSSGLMYDFLIDVNGLSSPNVIGRDLFAIRFDDYGNEIISDINSESCLFVSNDVISNGRSIMQLQACFRRVQSNGWKMDY